MKGAVSRPLAAYKVALWASEMPHETMSKVFAAFQTGEHDKEATKLQLAFGADMANGNLGPVVGTKRQCNSAFEDSSGDSDDSRHVRRRGGRKHFRGKGRRRRSGAADYCPPTDGDSPAGLSPIDGGNDNIKEAILRGPPGENGTAAPSDARGDADGQGTKDGAGEPAADQVGGSSTVEQVAD